MSVRVDPIDAELSSKFSALRARIRLALLLEAGAVGAGVFLAFAVLSAPLDYFLHLDRAQRGILLAAFLAAAFWLVVRPLASGLRVSLSPRGLAAAVERAFPTFEDRLVSAVEFAGEGGPVTESADLRALVVRDALAISRDAEFVRAVDGERLSRHRLIAVGAAVLVAAAGAATPANAATWFSRNVLLSGIRWPKRTFLTVEGMEPGGANARRCPKGEDCPIVIRASGATPAAVQVFLKFDKGDPSARIVPKGAVSGAAGAREERYPTVIPRLFESFSFVVRGGDDVTDPYFVRIQERPQARSIAVRYTPPDYLVKRPPAPQPPLPVEGTASTISLPFGSAVEIEAVSSKPLAPSGSALLWTRGKEKETQEPVAVDSDRVRFRFELLKSGRVLLRLKDTEGLESASEAEMTFVAKEDEDPRVLLKLKDMRERATPLATLQLSVDARDDIELTGLSLMLEREPGKAPPASEAPGPPAGAPGAAPAEPPKPAAPKPVERPISGFRPGLKAFQEERLEVPLAGLPLEPGDVLILWAEAKDNDTKRGPKIGRSDKIRVHILSKEELLGLLLVEQVQKRKDFERLLEAQRGIRKDFLPLLPDLVPGSRLTEKETAEARSLDAEERRVIRGSEDVSKDLQRILSEQKANKIGDAAEAGRLQGIVEALQGVAQRTLPKAAEGLQAAAKNDPASRPPDVGPRTSERLEQGEKEMEKVLAQMLKLETIKEIVEMISSLKKREGEIHEQTLGEYRKLIETFFDHPDDGDRKKKKAP